MAQTRACGWCQAGDQIAAGSLRALAGQYCIGFGASLPKRGLWLRYEPSIRNEVAKPWRRCLEAIIPGG
jgi:hypothetical protein